MSATIQIAETVTEADSKTDTLIKSLMPAIYADYKAYVLSQCPSLTNALSTEEAIGVYNTFSINANLEHKRAKEWRERQTQAPNTIKPAVEGYKYSGPVNWLTVTLESAFKRQTNDIVLRKTKPPEGTRPEDFSKLDANWYTLQQYILRNQPEAYAGFADTLDAIGDAFAQKAKNVKCERGIEASSYIQWQQEAADNNRASDAAVVEQKIKWTEEQARRKRRAAGLPARAMK